MIRIVRRVAVPLVGRRARLRWVHLVLGGALLMPYFLVALVVCESVGPPFPDAPGPASQLWRQLAAYLLCLPLVAVTAGLRPVRPLEAAAARALMGVDVATGPATSRAARFRAGVWYLVHLSVGAPVAAVSLAVPPMAVLFAALPLLPRRPSMATRAGLYDAVGAGVLGPVTGLALVAGLLVLSAGAGAVLARLAVRLLGPSPAERVAELERRAARQAERNRVARELHDSVGHALSVVTLQAAAAGRVMDRDPEFARRALAVVERTARDALADLDHVLGLLREEPSDGRPAPTLADLDRLLAGAGVAVDARVDGELGAVTAVVSREAYRIVQEGLTNAVRHAGGVPVVLRIRLRDRCLEVALSNPLPPGGPPPGTAGGRTAGGRGLAGIRERVATLRGEVTAGPRDGRWHLSVRIPV